LKSSVCNLEGYILHGISLSASDEGDNFYLVANPQLMRGMPSLLHQFRIDLDRDLL